MNEAVLMATATGVLPRMGGKQANIIWVFRMACFQTLMCLRIFQEDSIEDFCENICLNALLPGLHVQG